MLHSFYDFCFNLRLPSLAEDRLPFSLLYFFTGGTTALRSTIRSTRWPTYVLKSSERWAWGARAKKNKGLASRMAKFDTAGGPKRACRFALLISSSRAFRRCIKMANRVGGSKVTASTSQAGPREPPIRKAQIVSFADLLWVPSYQC